MVNCPICKRQFKTAAALAQHKRDSHSAPAQPVRRVPRVARNPNPQSLPAGGFREGELVIGREELLDSPSIKAQVTEYKKAIFVKPSADVLPWLGKLAANFEQIEWHSIKLVWKPAVGTTFNGSVVIGVDWNANTTEATRAKAQAAVPHIDTPIWQKGVMVLPQNRLQSRKTYVLGADSKVDQGPGVVLFTARVSAPDREVFLGDLWLDYKVRLIGPTA
uniref:Capsid protein n=1 Tax=Culex impudicus luteo-like virus TaxID=2805781 RepID=A0A889IP28_9LUTE|nr:MAG: capsid [Culex impudicus luteo-like virus]